MVLIDSSSPTKIRGALGIFDFLRKHWYLVTIAIFILPAIFHAIQVSVQTNNWSYPFFDLASQLFTADAVIQSDVQTLQTDPVALVGMAHPAEGIWKHTVYYWFFFWRVIYRISTNVWFLFFPLVLIYKGMRLRNNSEPLKTFAISGGLFLVYLFVTNAVILAHGLVAGNGLIAIPEGMDKFNEYFFIFKLLLPFHGLWTLLQYGLAQIIG